MRRMRVIPVLLVCAGLGFAGSAYYLSKSGKGGTPSAANIKAVSTVPVAHHDDTEDQDSEREPASILDHEGEHGLSRLSSVGDGMLECRTIEFPGRGPAKAVPALADWSHVMDSFHQLKDKYAKWFNGQKEAIPEKAWQAMSARMAEIRLERPPTPDEPDLAWRGIGVWSLDDHGKPMIRVGDGFLTLFKLDPNRGRFELARLMAQAWAPCEWEKAQFAQPWQELAHCLGTEEIAKGCASGAFSDAGWAVATALAHRVAAPGCRVPAFESKESLGCVSKMPFGKSWKEAHR